MVSAATHVWWHHTLRSVAVATTVATHGITIWRTHSWKGAAETGGSALEVGEAAGWAGPISWAWAIFINVRLHRHELPEAVEEAGGEGEEEQLGEASEGGRGQVVA